MLAHAAPPFQPDTSGGSKSSWPMSAQAEAISSKWLRRGCVVGVGAPVRRSRRMVPATYSAGDLMVRPGPSLNSGRSSNARTIALMS